MVHFCVGPIPTLEGNTLSKRISLLAKLDTWVVKNLQHNTLGSQHGWGLIHQIRSDRDDPSSSSDSRMLELSHQLLYVECSLYAPVIVPIVRYTVSRAEAFTSASNSLPLKNLPFSR
jgi:hypothetical protein